MRKIFFLFLISLSVVLLASCNNVKATFQFKLEDGSATRTTYEFNYSLTDEDGQLKYSEIKYVVKKDGSSATYQDGTFDKAKSVLTLKSLEAGTKYLISVNTVLNNEEYNIIKDREFSTLSQGGSDEDPYEISDAESLLKLLKADNLGHFKLVADIDLEGQEIAPIYTSSSAYFNGTFDGNGHTIKNFKLGSEEEAYAISSAVNYAGFFGAITTNGVIKNVTFENAQLYLKRGVSTTTYFSVVAGYNAGLMENVTVKDSKLVANGSSKAHYVGVLCARLLENGKVNNSKVLNTEVVFNNGRSLYLGGLVGINESKAGIFDSEFSGNIAVNSELIDAIALSTIITDTIKIGGIAGQNNSKVLACKVDANIKLATNMPNASQSNYRLRTLLGGLVGHNFSDAAVLSKGEAKVNFDINSKEATLLYVGYVMGLNGGFDKEKAYALILDTVALNKEESNLVYCGKLNLGLVGLDKSENSAYSTEEELVFNLVEYANKKAEATLRELKVQVNKAGYEVKETIKDNCKVTLNYSSSVVSVKVVNEGIDLNNVVKGTNLTLKLTFTEGHELAEIQINGEAANIALDENGQFSLDIDGDKIIAITVSHHHE